MEVKAIHKYARSSAQKTRLVADQVRGLPVQKALDLLQFSPRKAAALIRKVLLSAISNAEHNQSLDIDDLVVSKIMVDEGPSLKRIMPRAKGRADRIVKRTSHITVVVADSVREEFMGQKINPNGIRLGSTRAYSAVWYASTA